MQQEKSFKRLPREVVQILFEEPLNIIRTSYIDILTLLHDLLARYSQKGYGSVFLSIEDAQSIVFANVNKIKQFSVENVLEQMSLNVKQQALKEHQKIVAIDINRPYRKRSKTEFDDTTYYKVGGRLIKRPKRGKRIKVAPLNIEGLVEKLYGFHNTLFISGVGRTYTTNVLVDYWNEKLFIYEDEIPFKEFTFEKFRQVFGLKKLPQDKSAETTFEKLLEIVNMKMDLAKTGFQAQIEFYKTFQKILLETALQNINSFQNLRETVRNSLQLSKEGFDEIDMFLDGIVEEYQLLRKYNPNASPPPRSSQRSSSNPKEKDIDSTQKLVNDDI